MRRRTVRYWENRMARKRKKQAREKNDIPDRPEQTKESPEERHRQILGSPRTPYDAPGKTRTGWRPGTPGGLTPYPIVDGFLTCPSHDCTRFFTDDAVGRAVLANHRKRDH